jgi:uncharacterized protein (DUF1697 family)
MERHVCLLRGINVGGNNMISMVALRACFEEAGFADVATYIQSGNVLFTPRLVKTAAELAKNLEALLSSAFNYQATVVVRDAKQMKDIVRKAPKGFGTKPDHYRYDVTFLKEPLKAAEALKVWPMKEGVDTVAAGPGVIYTSRLIAKVTQSGMNRIVALPIYKSMTIRNWNTTTKLLALMD